MTNISLEPEGAWIEWNGGECPLGREDVAEIRYRDGRTSKVWAYLHDWNHRSDMCPQSDIIAYRPVKP